MANIASAELPFSVLEAQTDLFQQSDVSALDIQIQWSCLSKSETNFLRQKTCRFIETEVRALLGAPKSEGHWILGVDSYEDFEN